MDNKAVFGARTETSCRLESGRVRGWRIWKLAVLCCIAAGGSGIVLREAEGRMLGREEIEAAAEGFLERDVLARHLLSGRSVAGLEAKGALWVAELDPSGHIVLAGSDRAEPIVGFSAEDYAEPEEGSPAAALYAAKTAAVEALEAGPESGANGGWAKLLGDGGGHPGTRSGPVEPAAGAVYVEPFMSSQWDQCQPYNDYAPVWSAGDRDDGYRGRDPCGCVATATAQVLRHFRWPARIGGTRTVEHAWYDGLGNGKFTVRFDGRAPIDWDVFGDEYPWYGGNGKGHDLRGTLLEADRYPVARLTLWADSLAEMMFESDGSAASYNTVARNLSEWYTAGRWVDAKSDDLSAVLADLERGIPVQVQLAGHEVVGHGWAEAEGKRFIYLNFGWGGAADGYYNLAEDAADMAFESILTGHFPRAKAQISPMPAVTEGEVELSWDFPALHATALDGGFTVVLCEAGPTSETVLEDFEDAAGTTGGEGVSVGTNATYGQDGALLEMKPYEDGCYTLGGTAVLTGNSELLFKVRGVYAQNGEFRAEARYGGGEWETIAEPSLPATGSSQWETITVGLGDHADQTVQIRFINDFAWGTYYPSGRIFVDDVRLDAVRPLRESRRIEVGAEARSVVIAGLAEGTWASATVVPVQGAGALAPAEASEPAAWRVDGDAALKRPEVVSVLAVDGSELPEGFYRECERGREVFFVECTPGVVALRALPSHLSLLPDSAVSVGGMGQGRFVVELDASNLPAASDCSRMILTLEATDSNGTVACRDLSLRFSSETAPDPEWDGTTPWDRKVDESLWSWEVAEDGGAKVTGGPAERNLVVPRMLGGLPVTEIGQFAFQCCSGLETVTIPEGVKRIGYCAFVGSGLTSAIIPDSVTNVAVGAFGNCPAALYDTSTVPQVLLVDGWAVECSASLAGALDLAGCRGVGNSAFSGCAGLTAVTIPGSVRNLGTMAFSRCTGLKEATIGNGMEEIRDGVFYECTGLESVTLPDGLASIGEEAFDGCSGLKAVSIPDGVTEIGELAFSRSGLTSVDIPDGVTELKMGVFGSCPGLVSVSIPDSVTDIGGTAFTCSGLTSVTIPASVTNIGIGAFSYSPLTSVAIPDSVETIGDEAFARCSGLASASIGNGVKSIGENAFGDCRGLTEVVIPDSVENIGEFAFSQCNALASLTLGRGVTNIGKWAFFYCSGLDTVTLPASVRHVAPFAFAECSLSGFEVAEGNRCFASENGILFSRDGKTLACYPDTRGGAYAIPDGVVRIEDGAFAYCVDLTSVEIPASVKSIGYAAFYGCSRLASVDIGNGVESVGELAFYNCSGLSKLSVPPDWKGKDMLADAGVPARCEVVYRTPTEQRVFFLANGGTCGTEEKTYPVGEAYGEFPIPKWSGHFWRGWYTAETGGTEVTTNDLVAAEAERTLYAHWTAFQVTTFKGNGGTPETQKTTNTVSMAYGTLPAAKRSGYALSGWYTKASGGTQVTTNSIVTADAKRTLYAHWTTKQVTTFKGNGGTPSSQKTTNTVAKTYKFPTATWKNHAFMGWFTKAEDGTQVTVDSKVTEASKRTLYAHWTDRQVTTFKGNGGTPSSQKTTNTMAKAYGTLPTATWKNHAFLGWFTKESGGTEVTADSKVSEAAKRTLYAHWTTKQVTTFKGNGGTPDKQKTTNTVGKTYGKLPTPAWKNHVFLGWFTKAEGGTQVTADSKVSAAAKRTLYAHWTNKQVTTFKGNGGTPSSRKTTNTMAKAYGPLPEATWSNHVCLGWFTSKTGGTQVTADTKVTVAAKRTLYAHWTDKQVTTFKGNGGTPSSQKTTNTMGTAYGKLPKATWKGHAFLGWFTKAEGGTQVEPDSLVTAAAKRTLFAQWTDANGKALPKTPAVSGFAFGNGQAAMTRSVRNAMSRCTVAFEAEAGVVYEIQWTPALCAGWTTMRRWAAESDGETELAVELPAGAPAGFFRVSVPAASGGTE